MSAHRLKSLMHRHPRIIDLSLERMHALLEKIGNPHHRLPPVIHVAGTNGKGSTIALLSAILTAQGYGVHRYHSPHLMHVNERILLAGQEISDDELDHALHICEEANIPCTLFEILTAAAFHVFAHHPADILLLETGLGGRYDATNVLAHPLACVITSIAIDHTHFLGNSLRHIAREKAGIIKKGVPFISAPQHPHVRRLLAAYAKRVGASRIHDAWQINIKPHHFTYEGGSLTNKLTNDYPPPSLYGTHQYENAGLALATLECLEGFACSTSAIERGLREVQWRGRLEKLTPSQLRALHLPEQLECWMDGGHNPEAAHSLAQTLSAMPAKPTHILWSMLKSKDVHGFIAQLKNLNAHWHSLTLEDEPAAITASQLAQLLREHNIHSDTHETLQDALACLRLILKGDERILMCGSLYLVGALCHAMEHQIDGTNFKMFAHPPKKIMRPAPKHPRAYL